MFLDFFFLSFSFPIVSLNPSRPCDESRDVTRVRMRTDWQKRVARTERTTYVIG